jgi:ribosomal protein L37E
LSPKAARPMNARRRILLGTLLLISSIPFFFYGITNAAEGLRPEWTWVIVTLAIGSVVALVGFILVIDGRTAAWQMGQRRSESVRRSVASGVGAALATQGTPSDAHGRPGGVRAIPGRRELEEPSTKRCPACGKDVYKEARVCRFCGHGFSVTLRLKVYPPTDETQKKRLVVLLADKLKMPEGEVAHLLDLGMRFKYDSAPKLAAARRRFESLGCATEVYEKAGRE